MPSEIFELQDWESWEIPGQEGRPSGLRITTDAVLPFDSSALLKVCLGPEGLEFLDEDRGVKLLLTPQPQPFTLALFMECARYFIPVVLTEVDFPNNKQRTWLAAPRRPRQ